MTHVTTVVRATSFDENTLRRIAERCWNADDLRKEVRKEFPDVCVTACYYGRSFMGTAWRYGRLEGVRFRGVTVRPVFRDRA